MSNNPEPTIIDRRHPAWVAAFASFLGCADKGESATGDELAIRYAANSADVAYLEVLDRDMAQAAALHDHRTKERAAHADDVNALAVERHNKLFGSLSQTEKDEIRSEIARRQFEAHKADNPSPATRHPLHEELAS